MTDKIRRWIVVLTCDVLAAFYERCIRPDVSFCGHGYISATCAHCVEIERRG